MAWNMAFTPPSFDLGLDHLDVVVRRAASVRGIRKRQNPRGSSPDGSSGGPRGLMRAMPAGRTTNGIKKAGGPIWPTALVRPEGGLAACGLARDGRRSPANTRADRRDASVEEQRIRRHSSASV